MHGFCSSSAFYSASLSFRMCVFLLAPFDTLKSQPGIAYKSVVYKKACNSVFFPSKNEEILCHMSFLLCLSGISLGQCC